MPNLKDLFEQVHFAPQGEKPSLEEFVAAHEKPAPTSIRINTKKYPFDTENKKKVPWCPKGFYLPQRPIFTLDPLLHAGAYYVQEAGSMLTGFVFNQVFKDKKQINILDLSAAPGGKSTHIADLIEEDSLLISNEVIQSRAQVLAENATKWGRMNQWVTQHDPKELGRLEQFFDCIIIDAPCSGSGLWRRDLQTTEEWSVEHVKLCSERQKRIIADIAPALKGGGYIIYSTCSYSREENEDIVDWMCDNFGWEAKEIKVETDWNIEISKSENNHPAYRCAPWRTESEGFFIALIQKPQQTEQKKRTKTITAPKINKEVEQLLQKWLSIPALFIEKNTEFLAIPKALENQYAYLIQNKIRIKKTGVAMGKIIKKQLIPNEELALCVQLNNQYGSLDLDKEKALQYLKKEEIHHDEILKGWYLITYQGLGLGWSKWMEKRMNNYYPKNWRIRMEIPQ